ncbi:MAG: hypothetical protein PVF20_08705, partial [Desulfobacterales bacterium]
LVSQPGFPRQRSRAPAFIHLLEKRAVILAKWSVRCAMPLPVPRRMPLKRRLSEGCPGPDQSPVDMPRIQALFDIRLQNRLLIDVVD